MIPDEIKQLASSVEIFDKCQAIGKLFGFHVDQIGELDAEIRDILDGRNKSSDFTAHIMKRLDITREIADKVATEANKEVFDFIKSKLGNSISTSSLEVAGNFSIEKELTTNSEPTPANITPANKAKILNDIEFPMSVKGRLGNMETGSSYADNHTEPLVDQLLSMPTNIVEQKVVVSTPDPVKPASKLPEAPTNLPVSPEPPKKLPDLPPKPRGPDLYRESIK